MHLALTLLLILMLLGHGSAQTAGDHLDENVPLSIQTDPVVSARYADALKNHPELLGGKYKDSPTFVGGQAYTYDHCVKLARWVLENDRAIRELSAVELGNLWYTLDDGCQFIYGLYGDPEARMTAKKIPVSPEKYADDSRAMEAAVHTTLHAYIERLDQVVAALPHDVRLRLQPLLEHPGDHFKTRGYALWQPLRFLPAEQRK
jgi:hypothetical protein